MTTLMMTANDPLIGKIERHLLDVSRISSRTFGPRSAVELPGRIEIVMSTALAGVCAQVVIMTARLEPQPPTGDQQALAAHAGAAGAALLRVAELIKARTPTETLQDQLESVFEQLTAAITLTSALRRPLAQH